MTIIGAPVSPISATNEDVESAPRTASRRLRVRAAAVAGTVAITTGFFLVARAAGADFTITDPGTGKIPHTFVPPEIAIVTAVIGLLGWMTLAGLERCTRRADRIWTRLAVSIVLLSLVPIWIERATTQTRLSLAVVHILVGVCLLPLPSLGRLTGAPAVRTSAD